MLFSKGVRKHCYKINVRTTRERAGGVCMRAARAGRAYLLSMRKNEKCWETRVESMRKNERGEYAGGARESKRNDWTDNHTKARAGKWLKRE